MDKNEYNMKIDQIRQAVRKRDIETAVKIADEIDWKREKDSSLLVVGADAYELNRQYAKAKELLVLAYERTQTGKSLAYRLALVSAKTKEFDEALEFYHDFVDMAPRDTARYVLQYRIAKAKGESLDFLIEILEEFVSIDMEEKWMYELAKLYHMAGEKEKCVDLCDEMSLWFSHGDYVRRAMDLKMKYRPLTKRQQENYNKTDAQIAAENKAMEKAMAENDAVEEALNNTQNEQVAVADNSETPEKTATIPFTTMSAEQFRGDMGVIAQDITKQSVVGATVEPETVNSTQVDAEAVAEEAAEMVQPIRNTETIPGEINIEDIHVKPFVGNGSDTIDIQAEIAKNIQEIMDNEESKQEILKNEKQEPEDLTVTLDPLYKYDANGQIGLDIQEPAKKDKQITGQISIEEVLRNLEERGVLKADTVNKTVETMDQAAEAVDKAAEEAAVRAEMEKKNETVVQNLEMKDLAEDGDMAEVKLALESYADDAANGFVFTDEIDSEAIEKAMRDATPMPMPESKTQEVNADKTKTQEVKTDKTKSEEDDVKEAAVMDESLDMAKKEDSSDIMSDDKAIEDLILMAAMENAKEMESEPKIKGTPVELANDIPVLDLSFEAPVKKIHTGIAPETVPVPANTESLKELFADLDEATKREIGIETDADAKTEEEDKVQVNAKDATEENVKEEAEIEKTVEKETKAITEAVANEIDKSDTNIVEQEDVQPTVEKVAEEIAQSIAEEVAEEIAQASTDASAQTVEAEAVAEQKAAEQKIAEETIAQQTPAEQTPAEQTPAENTEAGENVKKVAEHSEAVTEEPKEQIVDDTKNQRVPDGMPVVTTTINKHLTQPISLDIDKIVVSDEEMIPFESFKTVNGLEQKIKDTVTTLVAGYEGLGNSKTGNIMILGDDKSGKTTMAIELIKLINKKRERGGRRIAKVDSSVLNTRGIRSSMKKLVGSDLIVENAQHLRKSVLQEFLAVGQYYTDNMLMVFEGETSALKTMRNENEDIAHMFDHVLVIKEYDVKEWVAYAKKYAATKNYMIDEMGTLALYKSIDDFYGKHQGIDQNDVESIINGAIKKASGKIGRKLTNLFSGKNDDSGMDILKEVDFK